MYVYIVSYRQLICLYWSVVAGRFGPDSDSLSNMNKIKFKHSFKPTVVLVWNVLSETRVQFYVDNWSIFVKYDILSLWHNVILCCQDVIYYMATALWKTFVNLLVMLNSWTNRPFWTTLKKELNSQSESKMVHVQLCIRASLTRSFCTHHLNRSCC